MFLNAASLDMGRARLRVRLAALSLCVTGVVGATGALAVPAAPHARADPAPSAQDVRRGEERVRERAAEVGRTKARLAQANGELERLAAASALAVERYNGQLVKLERSRGAVTEARNRVAEAGRRVGAAQSELAVYAADAYRVNTGYNGWSAVVAGQGGPQGFMDRAGMVEMLARRRAAAIQRVEVARSVADVFQRQASAAYDEQRLATERAETAKHAAEVAVTRQRTSVQEIETERRRLERSLGEARARAARLERERQAALERAEERRVRAALQANADGPVPGLTLTGSKRGDVVVGAALQYLGTPYSWGGGNANGPSYGIAHGAHIYGFDCSGLALYAWAKVGVQLDHWTGTQWTSGPHIPLDRLRRGDLVFFAHDTSDPDTIHHVGIFIGKGRMVEAPYTGARVRISTIWRDGLIGATRPAG
ncbi:NlpC/P60 family protein [Actinomadura vinacea]|uniref:NlpC/P60 family protein n=1 Tax=Actinomadura vinacea TaxID=115336 RepID=A0ABN3IID8_9ACTN